MLFLSCTWPKSCQYPTCGLSLKCSWRDVISTSFGMSSNLLLDSTASVIPSSAAFSAICSSASMALA